MPPSLPPPRRSSFSVLWSEVVAMTGLFWDLSFRQFITPRIVRTVYVISLLGAALAAGTWMLSGFKISFMQGMFTLCTGPLAFLIYIITARVGLEFMLAVFRIAENTEKLREKSDRRQP